MKLSFLVEKNPTESSLQLRCIKLILLDNSMCKFVILDYLEQIFISLKYYFEDIMYNNLDVSLNLNFFF